MRQELRITIDGRTYNVIVETVTSSSSETFYPSPNMRSDIIEPTIAEPRTPRSTEKLTPFAANARPGDVVSPMSGVLVEYTVKAGDPVAVDQQVATIEAMKMKTVIVSHLEGTVAKLHLEPGAPVEAGQPLVSIG